jgi:DMSO reductase family type II enzyme heme b subunit
MPGSSMPPWGHLSQVERDAIVDEIMRLRADGARAQYLKVLVEDEELTAEEIAEEDIQQDIQEFVDRFTTPGELSAAPAIGPATPEGLERAKAAYATFGCLQCHGEDGKGNGVRKMVDDEGYPTAPRDFTAGIFKGSPDPESLYRRIAYGLPGTPMPSSQQMTPEQGVDLVHYVLSMSTKAQRDAAVLNRTTVKVKRVSKLPADMSSSSWSAVPAVAPRIMPLWWRNNADPGLEVQAVHDGKVMALRLTWRDESHDDAATKTEAFEDAVAMQLYRGTEEPFLGMGGPGSPVDVWFWDADRQRASDVEDQYPRVVADIYPFNEKNVDTAEFQREGTRGTSQPAVSLPAQASGNPIVPEHGAKSGGSSLSMGGPGSTTFRLPKSQLVNARGAWKEGRWAVVMTRPLAVAATKDGISLPPGAKASAAFAIWNGSAHDRDGMKLITIWQDMHLDP